MSVAGCTFGNKCEGNLPLPSQPGKPLKDMEVLENKHNFATVKTESKDPILSRKPKGGPLV
jgi:hypothetical protein